MRQHFPLMPASLLPVAGVIILIAGLVGCASFTTQRAAQTPVAYSVASANPYATDAGMKILAQGGSAVDAAIAVQAVLGLVEPQSSGLAGGAFMIFYDPATDDITTYDGREIAPTSATPNMFLKKDGTPMEFYDAQRSPQSVGVPGVLAMLSLAHQEHGQLDRKAHYTPALKLAEEGFEISPRLHNLLMAYPKMADTDTARDYYFDENGAPLPIGHLLKSPAYAETLKALMVNGTDAFYDGVIMHKIIKAVNDAADAPLLTPADFAAYAPVQRAAVCNEYQRKKICSMGPPSSGATTMFNILNILSHTDFDAQAPASPAAWHRLIEASKLAYADRSVYLGDPDFMAHGHFDADAVVTALIDDEYAKKRAALITGKAMKEAPIGNPLSSSITSLTPRAAHLSQEPVSTSHFSIRDAQGRIVSMTTTVESIFGSHLMAGGMILNNQLTDFSFEPSRESMEVVNAAAPGKRPRSSMSPLIIFNEDGSVFGAFGSPGGSAIIGYVTKTIIGVLNWNLPLQEAIDLPNVVFPHGVANLEEGHFNQDALAEFTALGHEYEVNDQPSGVYGFIIRGDIIEGGADKRKEGNVAVAAP